MDTKQNPNNDDTIRTTVRLRRELHELARGERSPAQMLGIRPEIIRGLYVMGRDAWERGNLESADRAFTRCAVLEPRVAEHWMALGAARFALGRVEEAAALYQVAALLTPSTTPLLAAASCFESVGRTSEADAMRQLATQSDHEEDLEILESVA